MNNCISYSKSWRKFINVLFRLVLDTCADFGLTSQQCALQCQPAALKGFGLSLWKILSQSHFSMCGKWLLCGEVAFLKLHVIEKGNNNAI